MWGDRFQDDKSQTVWSPQTLIVISKCNGTEGERRKQRAIVGSINVCLGSVRSDEQYVVGWNTVILEQKAGIEGLGIQIVGLNTRVIGMSIQIVGLNTGVMGLSIQIVGLNTRFIRLSI